MALLIQFLLRLTFGLALGMAITSPKLVTSGYYRNHLYVTLGLSALAAMLSFSVSPSVAWYAVAAAACSYLGSVYWLFEKPGPGVLMLVLIAVAAWYGASEQWGTLTAAETARQFQQTTEATAAALTDQASELESSPAEPQPALAGMLSQISVVSSGLLLGFAMAAMLLGHWYLNSPGMQMAPLQRLILAIGVAVGLQALVSLVGIYFEMGSDLHSSSQWLLFLLLRWTFGIVGVAVTAWMAWQTLKIPNTQSATGILYVAVIGTFVGETMALLLSTESLFPL